MVQRFHLPICPSLSKYAGAIRHLIFVSLTGRQELYCPEITCSWPGWEPPWPRPGHTLLWYRPHLWPYHPRGCCCLCGLKDWSPHLEGSLREPLSRGHILTLGPTCNSGWASHLWQTGGCERILQTPSHLISSLPSIDHPLPEPRPTVKPGSPRPPWPRERGDGMVTTSHACTHPAPESNSSSAS